MKSTHRQPRKSINNRATDQPSTLRWRAGPDYDVEGIVSGRQQREELQANRYMTSFKTLGHQRSKYALVPPAAVKAREAFSVTSWRRAKTAINLSLASFALLVDCSARPSSSINFYSMESRIAVI